LETAHPEAPDAVDPTVAGKLDQELTRLSQDSAIAQVLEARLAERARAGSSKKYLSAKKPDPPSVRFIDNASSNATVLELRAPDSIGLLHRVAKTLAELSLDIRHARVHTLGNEVVDTFYVRTQMGDKVTNSEHQREIERALLHAVS
jgi:[protein-PII] uridylyltransferase